jgi:hypothetical protein
MPEAWVVMGISKSMRVKNSLIIILLVIEPMGLLNFSVQANVENPKFSFLLISASRLA